MLRHWATYIRLDTAAWRRHFGGWAPWRLRPLVFVAGVCCWCLLLVFAASVCCDCGLGDDQSGRRGWLGWAAGKVRDVQRFKERSVAAGGGYG